MELKADCCDVNLFNSANNFVAMGSFFGHKDGISRSVSETPPTHYAVTIQSFSLLSKNAEKYESAAFEAGGYKWKLILHPNGNKSKKVEDHISVYLAMADASSLPTGWEVHAVFRLFLLDQNQDNYLIAQDSQGKQRRFHRLKPELGFDHFIPIQVLSDASNGYLVDDTCVLGAEVFVSKERSTGKGECLEMIKDPRSFKHVWKVENFSKLDTEYYDSKEFTVAGYKWKMKLYPKERDSRTGSHLSLYLVLADLKSLTPASKIYVDYALRIQDQVQTRDISAKKSHWFSASSRESGWEKFISSSFFLQASNGCLVKDVCFFEAEVTIWGIASAL
ncbi:protein RESTRICTED TEV MOVEMENT 3 [Mangifera indica]|uniref:protein RESTRICTED TEV MOVEMENT 3 n=1 Tax=Mangifera indica TaxID=29780 RepID=UPI001CFB934E|nr:protein RESTRICTED TEV MOVEMENT 3 [Mangifera indica]